jgi:mono/diheme cytochrome c family protein
MRALKPAFLASLVVLAGATVLVIAVTDRAAASRVAPAPAEATAHLDPVERGHYLVKVIGCSDCHTPKVMTDEGPVLDETRLLSGHPDGGALPPAPAASGPWIATASWDLTAWSGPWGLSYTANLTPDENTGLGIWTEDMFLRAIRTGRHMGQSRPILPPMPWQFYRDLTDDDLKAIYAYLRTIPPVHNRVPEPVPPAGVEVAAFE